MELVITLLVFFGVLSVLVLIHEFGHFITAKRFGIKVEEFGFGLPPRLFGKKIGETIYSINWLPIGGFVKLLGEDEETKKDIPKTLASRTFYSRPIWQRVIVLTAGVIMNFLLSVVIVTFIFTQGVMVPGGEVKVVSVLPSTPAEAAGLQKGDIITSIEVNENGQPKNIEIKEAKLLGDTACIYLGQNVLLHIKRNGENLAVGLTPRTDYPANEGPMGLALNDLVEKKYSLLEAPVAGITESLKRMRDIVRGLVMTVTDIVGGKSVDANVGGPVRIAEMTGEVRKLGILPLLEFMGFLSLNLAILNILPFPALDGGRLAFVLGEAIFGRKAKPAIERYAHLAGMAILLSLILFITINDIKRLIIPTPADTVPQKRCQMK